MADKLPYEELKETLAENKQTLEKAFQYTNDLQLQMMTLQQKKALVCSLETMADEQKMGQQLTAIEAGISLSDMSEKVTTIQEIVEAMLLGNTVILLEEKQEGIVLQTVQEHERTPDEPENERVVQGAHNGFIENLDINVHLIRRCLQQENLHVTYKSVGKQNENNVAIVYLKGEANEETIQYIEDQLEGMQEKKVTVIGELVNYLLRHVKTIFPKKLYTERPDRTTAYLTEGKIAILMDNSAIACIVPISFFAFFHSPDDFNGQVYDGILFRFIRLASFFGALIFPATYIAIITFHFEIIPFEMVTLVKNSIETVPFPPFFEAFIMIVTIELIREAGIRLPSPIGQTIGIVGGIIIGEAVVTAGLVSNVVVIVIALTAIMSFTISSYEMGNILRILSFPIMVAASLFGFVGIVASTLIILFHLCKVKVLDTPYFYPLAPFDFASIKRTLFRFHTETMDVKKK